MDISAIILAGGKSSRMGQDKGLLMYQGKMMIEHVIDSCSTVVSSIMVGSGNPEYNRFGYPVFEDRIKEAGPIGGIHAGLKFSSTEYTLFCPCDMPGIDHEIILKLKNSVQEQQAIVAATEEGKIIPVLGVYHKSALPVIEKQIAAGHYKMQELLIRLDVHIIRFAGSSRFQNINYPADIR